jgi:hypothetical protein
MRLVVALLLSSLAYPLSALATISEVASQRAASSDFQNVANGTRAFPNNVTAGNLLVVSGHANDLNDGHASIVVTDTLGTSYTVVLGTITSSSRPFIAYGIAPSSGANTVTVDPDGNTWMSFGVNEFTSDTTTIALDVNGGGSTGTGTTASDGITTATANALILGVVAFGGGTVTPGGSYTQISEHQGSPNAHNFEFRIATTATAYTVDWTFGASETWSAMTLSFEDAVAGGGAACQGMLLGVGC